MLAQVLPGIRELRGPLASGYLWLLALWLIASPDVPPRERATGVVADLYRLTDAVTVVGAAVAISFAAYLLGALTEGLLDIVVQRLRSVRLGGVRGQRSLERVLVDHVAERARKRQGALASIDAGYSEVRRAAETPTKKPARLAALRRRRDALLTELVTLETEAEVLFEQALAESELLPTRLQIKQPELFQTYDRLRAEAEVRFGVVLPLFFLCGALVVRHSPFWAFAVVLVVLIGLQGLRARIQAERLLADAVLLGEIVLPPLEREQRAIESFVAQVGLEAAWTDDPREIALDEEEEEAVPSVATSRRPTAKKTTVAKKAPAKKATAKKAARRYAGQVLR